LWTVVRSVVSLALVSYGAWVGFGLLRRRRLSLRVPLLIAGVWAGLAVVTTVLQTPAILAGYNTTMPIAGYLIWRWAGSLQGILLQGAQLTAVLALAAALLPEALGRAHTLREHLTLMVRRPPRWALVAAVLPLPLVALLERVFAILRDRVARDGLVSTPVPALDHLGTWQPAVHATLDAGREAIWLAAVGAAALLLVWRITGGRRWPTVGLVWLVVLTVGVGRFETPAQFVVDVAQTTLLAGLAWLVAARVLGWSPVAAAYVLFAALLLRDAFFFLSQPRGEYLVAGLAMVAVALAPVAWQLVHVLLGWAHRPELAPERPLPAP
jgi:hypothetical protein